MSEHEKNVKNDFAKRKQKQLISKDASDSASPHNVLERLLLYCVRGEDASGLARGLIDRFGSLRGVFDAPFDSLITVNGVGKHTAVLIKIVAESSKMYLEEYTSDIKYINSTLDAVAYLRPKFMMLQQETLYIICLSNAGKILKCSVVSEGRIDSTEIDARKILSLAIDTGASAAIIAHNHPGGICAPSKADKNITYGLARLLRSIHIKLINHIIITEDNYFSFADTPRFTDLFTEPQPHKSAAFDADTQKRCD